MPILKPYSPPIAGRRIRLLLEVPVETQDPLGGATIAYQPLLTLWASISAAHGVETEAAGRIEGTVDVRITLRWRPGVNASMRFSEGVRHFAIRAAFDPDGRKRDLVCLCQQIGP